MEAKKPVITEREKKQFEYVCDLVRGVYATPDATWMRRVHDERPVQIRAAVAYFLKRHFLMSNDKIAALMKRDRTTVYGMLDAAENALGYDNTWKWPLTEAIRRHLEARVEVPA